MSRKKLVAGLVTLSFETKADAENWIAGYMDGGGDQILGYDVEESKGFNLILRGYRQCPDCRFGDIGTMQEYKERYKELTGFDPSQYSIFTMERPSTTFHMR